MPLEAIQSIAGTENITHTTTLESIADNEFAQILADGLSAANGSLIEAERVLHDLALNKPVSTHEVMLVMEKAKMDLRLVVEVRNKLLEGYQELMRMQV